MFVVIPIKRIFINSSNATDMSGIAEWDSGTTYTVGKLAYLGDYIYQATAVTSGASESPDKTYEVWSKIKYREVSHSSLTEYQKDNIVNYNRRIYKCLLTRTDYTTYYPAPPTYPNLHNENWIDVGPENKWSMFDLNTNAQTVRDNDDNLTTIVYTYTKYDTLAIFGMVGTTLTITGTNISGTTTYYSKTVTLSTLDPPTGYEYAVPVSTSYRWVVFTDVPTTDADMKLTIAISSTSGKRPIKCGSVVLGRRMSLGDVQLNIRNDALNYSEVNSDLNSTLTSTPSRVRMSVETAIDYGTSLNNARFARDVLNGSPALWCAIDDTTDPLFAQSTVLGYYKNFGIAVNNPSKALLNIEVESI